MDKFTPLHIEILIHYNAISTDYRDGDFSAPAVSEYINQMTDAGLLHMFGTNNIKHKITTKGRAVVEYMCNTPIPVQEWKFPDRSN